MQKTLASYDASAGGVGLDVARRASVRRLISCMWRLRSAGYGLSYSSTVAGTWQPQWWDSKIAVLGRGRVCGSGHDLKDGGAGVRSFTASRANIYSITTSPVYSVIPLALPLLRCATHPLPTQVLRPFPMANMFDDDVFNDNALYDDFATAFAQPFTDVINAPPGFDSSPSPSPLRSSRGTENRAPSSTSPSIPVWKDGSEEEAKVLEDWGIEDSDEEEQAELFNRIPGFEDDWEYEAPPARDPEVAQLAGPMDNGYGALQDTFDDTAEPEDLEGYYGGDPSDEATGPTTTVDTSHATDSESDEEDLDAIHEHAVDSDDSEQRIADHEEALAVGDEESAAARFDDSDASSSSESEDPVEPDPVVGPSHQATVTPSTPLARPRRSARIARAPKRARPVESEGESDTELARPAKRVKSAPAPRRRATKAETPTSATTSAGASGKRKQRQLSSEPRPSRKTKPKKDAGTRRARIPKWFLDKHCLVAESAQKKCGVEGCKHELHLQQATDARKHIKGHYTKAQREGTEVPCLWAGCNRSIRNDKNPGGLMRHYDEQHLKLRYQCPGKCTDSQGQPRDWARVDEITRHEMETPCKYLREHPIPRGQTKDPDESAKPKKSKKSRSR